MAPRWSCVHCQEPRRTWRVKLVDLGYSIGPPRCTEALNPAGHHWRGFAFAWCYAAALAKSHSRRTAVQVVDDRPIRLPGAVGAVLMRVDESKAYPLIIRCISCGSYNSTDA
jgi:hypothetical protein